jgi:AcrR family transcriptional regulator
MPATPVPNPAYPLREKRKEKTRTALTKAAEELIFEVGFEEMTLDQVAERAEVHVQTLYRHFPTKLSILVHINEGVVQELEQLLASRDEGVTTFAVWRDMVKKYATITENGRAPYSPSGPAALAFQMVQDRYILALSKGLAEDMGITGRKDRRPFLIACMLKQANDIEAVRWGAEGRKGKLKTRLLRVADEVVDFCGELGAQGKPG